MDANTERQLGRILATVETTRDQLQEMRRDISGLLAWKAQLEAFNSYQKGLTDGQSALKKSQWALILGAFSLLGTLMTMIMSIVSGWDLPPH